MIETMSTIAPLATAANLAAENAPVTAPVGPLVYARKWKNTKTLVRQH
jgi:hypothetical protein